MKTIKDIGGIITGILIGGSTVFAFSQKDQTDIATIMADQEAKRAQRGTYEKVLDDRYDGVKVNVYKTDKGEDGYFVEYPDGTKIGFGPQADDFTYVSATST